MTRLFSRLTAGRHFARNDSGATAIEYGLIAGLIAVGIILAVTTLGGDLADTFGAVSTELNKVGSTTTTGG